MSNGTRLATFSIDEKLANLHLTQPQQFEAQHALRIAEDVVEIVEFIVGVGKRLAEAVSLKPGVRT